MANEFVAKNGIIVSAGGVNIPTGQTYKINNTALAVGNITGAAPLASPTFTGAVTLPSTTSIGNVSSTEIGYLDGITSSVQAQINGINPTLNTFRGNLGDPTIEEMAVLHGEFTNKFRFIPADLQEESTDGSTWTTSTRLTTNNLKDLMIGEGQTAGVNCIPAPSIGGSGYYRLTWNYGPSGYVCLNSLYIYCSTSGNTIAFTFEAYHNTNGWATIATGNINNWPGHVYLPHTPIWYSANASQYGKVRVTFSITSATQANAFTLYGIEWLGGYPAGRRNVESYDRDKNVTFPAGVTATSFSGPLTGNVTGNVSGTAASITGTYSGTLTSSQVTTALTFTPYNSTNPSGYTSNTGTVTSITAGTGLSGGMISTSGTIAVNYGTTASTACVGNDSRLSDARTPTSHAHGNITNAGYIGTTATLPIITGTGGILQAGSFGTGAGTFCQGNDSRLSDARTPTSHAHGNITNTGYIGSTATLPIITGTAGIVQAGAWGTTAGTFCQGNDSRLSDARTPTTHTHGTYDNSTALTGANVYSNIAITDGIVTGLTSRALSAADISAMSTSHAANAITGFGASGTATTVTRTDDSRLTDARTASDVYAWAKAATKPTYTYSEVGAAATSHTHDESQITNLTTDLGAKAPLASPTFTGTVVLPATTTVGGLDVATLNVNSQVPATQLPSHPVEFCFVSPADSAESPRYLVYTDRYAVYCTVICKTAPTASTTIKVYKNGSTEIASFAITTALTDYDMSDVLVEAGDTIHAAISGAANAIDLMTVSVELVGY